MWREFVAYDTILIYDGTGSHDQLFHNISFTTRKENHSHYPEAVVDGVDSLLSPSEVSVYIYGLGAGRRADVMMPLELLVKMFSN